MKKLLLAVFTSTASRLLASEAKEWLTWVPAALIRWAARQFKPEFRDRIEEEWLAHLNDKPTTFSKVWHGLGCALTAIKLNRAFEDALIRITIEPMLNLLLYGCCLATERLL